MSKAEDAIEKLKASYDVTSFHSRDDVSLVLSEIGKPGKNQDVKQQVIAKLFPRKSVQGRTTLDDIENYPEY